jgi:hypothetical protein
MIGLTARQNQLLRFIVRERAQGREPGQAALMQEMGFRARSGEHRLRMALEYRVPRREIVAMVPRAPDGARLKLVAVPGLPMPWEQR